jgi:DNA modification methylase
MSVNRLILGDNLDVMKAMDSETIDLIYLDPPFFSNRNYEVIWGDAGEVRSFEDRWAGGIEHYIAWLKERVIEMHRLLKPTGSFFLHCDDHANSYIQVDILDKIFLKNNFRSQITWKRSTAHNDAKQGRKAFGNISDTIWYYTKGNDYTFNQLYTPYSEKYIKEFYKYQDKNGRRYQLDNITGPGGAAKGNPAYEIMGVTRHWRYSKEKMQELINEGRIIQTNEGGVPRYKRYLDEMPGVPLQNIWDDINVIQSQSKERIGYPTQKPEALLERIIKCASNEGDIVLDPFVGGGTTVAIADKVNRIWIGIDQSVAAIKVSDLRLKNQQDLYSKPYELQLRTYDYDLLRNQNAFEFEKFIIEQFGGIPNLKQRNDFGLDGRMPDNTPIQVKRSDNIGRNVIDNFLSAVQRSDEQLFEKNRKNGKTVGHIIAFSFGRGAIEEVARLKNKKQLPKAKREQSFFHGTSTINPKKASKQRSI